MKNRNAQAHLLGVEAFTTGKPCIPALDTTLLEMLNGVKIGEGEPLFKSWLEGWHAANLIVEVGA